jgi:hypothetical protein
VNEVVLHPDMREKILQLQAAMQAYVRAHPEAEPDLPLRHTFAPGAYARQIFIPQGTLVVGKIHKHAHLNMLMLGTAIVATEDGIQTYQAPYVFTSLPGTKRVVVSVRDVIWVTVHLTEETDLEKIEAEIIAPTYADFDQLQGIDTAALAQRILEIVP